jgi:hypothetical protein
MKKLLILLILFNIGIGLLWASTSDNRQVKKPEIKMLFAFIIHHKEGEKILVKKLKNGNYMPFMGVATKKDSQEVKALKKLLTKNEKYEIRYFKVYMEK